MCRVNKGLSKYPKELMKQKVRWDIKKRIINVVEYIEEEKQVLKEKFI